MNKGIDKTEARLKDIIVKMELFDRQMEFREQMSEKYCEIINNDIQKDNESFWKSFYKLKVKGE
jgi:hypothetical protein